MREIGYRAPAMRLIEKGPAVRKDGGADSYRALCFVVRFGPLSDGDDLHRPEPALESLPAPRGGGLGEQDEVVEVLPEPRSEGAWVGAWTSTT